MKTVEFVLFVGAMVFYVRHLILDKNFVPNPVSFGIWWIVDIINCITYLDFSKHWVGPVIMPLGATIIVIIGIIRKAKVGKLNWIEWSSIVVCFISLLIYLFTGDSLVSNIIIQVILFVGFIPMVVKLIKEEEYYEPILPWLLFVIGWSFTTAITLRDHNSIAEIFSSTKSIVELIYPVINGVLGCAVVLLLSVYNRVINSIS